MDLMTKHEELKSLISQVDFKKLWPGFKPLKFAIYDEERVYFEDRYVPKTSQFVANTSIVYEDEAIAIWNVADEEDMEVLASLLIHEMFHSYQMSNEESRFPDENKALINYRYDEKNLGLKLKENHLIKGIILSDSPKVKRELFDELRNIRKYRYENYKYEYRYESAIEQIEGCANYVELEALRQLSQEKYEIKLESMLNEIVDPSNLLPIRIICYVTGALLIKIQRDNGYPLNLGFVEEPFAISMLAKVRPIETANLLDYDESVSKYIDSYNDKTKDIIAKAIAKNDLAFEGDATLWSANIYNARRYRNYIVSTVFVAYVVDSERKVLHGDYVIEMEGERITKIYRL